jgi:ankyrin repeat protein
MSDLETLIDAVKAGNVARVQELVRADPSLASGRLPLGESPLMAALYRGHQDVMKVLLDAGAELDVFAAAAIGRVDALKSAVGDARNVGRHAYDGWTPLHLAAFFGQIDAARLLLEAGADVNAVSQNSLANTPLHAATAGKHSEVALLLVASGANARAIDAGGYTPVQIATQNNLTEVVRAMDPDQDRSR